MALEKLGADSAEALAFEDSVSGNQSAVGAGIPTVGIASTQPPEVLRKAGAFVVAEDFTDADLRALIGARKSRHRRGLPARHLFPDLS